MLVATVFGVLDGKAKWLVSMISYQGGGEMITRVRFSGTQYNVIPHKFEAGTPNIAGVIGLAAAIDYINQLDLAQTSQYEAELLRYTTDAMQQIDGINLIGCADDKVSIISFTLDAAHAHDVATILNHQGIAIRSGHHCAMPIMDHYGIAATSRASLCFYNTKAEIDAFIQALAGVREVFS